MMVRAVERRSVQIRMLVLVLVIFYNLDQIYVLLLMMINVVLIVCRYLITNYVLRNYNNSGFKA